MKQLLIPFLLVLSFNCSAQHISDDYEYFATINHPTQDNNIYPMEILIDSMHQYLLVAYGIKPTLIEFYSIANMKKIKAIELKGFAYLMNSFFNRDNSAVYISRLKWGLHYVKIDLSNFTQQKVKSKDVEKGYRNELAEAGPIYFVQDPDGPKWVYTLSYNGWYLLKRMEDHTEIYFRK